MDKRVKYWNDRSEHYGDKIEGVIFKSFPFILNKYLHEWMVGYILAEIEKKKEKLDILDVGCGYGRVASELIKHNKKNRVYGVDISKTYVSLFNKSLKPFGNARVGDVKKLAFRNRQFDVALSVTTLMYMLNKKERNLAMSEIVRVTKSKGKIVLIEPNPAGQFLVTLGGLLSKKHGNSPKLTIDYTVAEIEKLVGRNKWRIEKKFGMPVFTICVLPLLASYMIHPNITKFLLKFIKKLDQKLSWILVPSLYVVYVGYEN